MRCTIVVRAAAPACKMMWVFLGLLLIGSAAAQVPFLGGCPKVDTVENFDTEKVIMI